jgi:hypothetical protein
MTLIAQKDIKNILSTHDFKLNPGNYDMDKNKFNYTYKCLRCGLKIVYDVRAGYLKVSDDYKSLNCNEMILKKVIL